VVGGVKVIISREDVGKDGVPKRDKGARVSSSFVYLVFLQSWGKLGQRLIL